MNTANSGGRERPIGHAGTAKQAPGRPSICKALREGIEAALRTDPAALANRKPRTGLELLIRGAVLNAHEGKMTALKLMMEAGNGERRGTSQVSRQFPASGNF
jgi:hypothetical protein